MTAKRFKTFWRSLRTMAAWLAGLGVTDAAMESTGVYWWPVYHALAQAGIEVCVCNAAHMRNVPGRLPAALRHQPATRRLNHSVYHRRAINSRLRRRCRAPVPSHKFPHRPDISQVRTDRASVLRCRRSLPVADGCCCPRPFGAGCQVGRLIAMASIVPQKDACQPGRCIGTPHAGLHTIYTRSPSVLQTCLLVCGGGRAAGGRRVGVDAMRRVGVIMALTALLACSEGR